MSVPERIAVVGMGGVFPAPGGGGPFLTPDGLWEHVLAGADASRDVPPDRWLLDPADAHAPGGPAPDRVYSRRGYFVDPFAFDPAGLDLPAGLVADLDPVFHLTLEAGRQAWQSAVTAPLDRRRVGVVLGNIALPTEKTSALAREVLGRTFAEKIPGTPIGGGLPRVAPLNRYPAGLPAGLLARALGLGGGGFTLDAACASSLYALALAAEELRAGRADAMLAGGVSRPDCLYTQMGFSQLRALSPSGRCAPFDARADGLLVGEGAGIFLLKRLADAERDGDHVLGVLVAAGLSNDVGGGLLAPSGEGQLRAMRAAYRAAGWSPYDVDYVECHATGTPVGDRVEYESLRGLWGASQWRPGQCVLSSVKSTVGHLLTAAGATGVAKVLAALQSRTLPPTANFTGPALGVDLAASPFRVPDRPQPWSDRASGTPRRAAVSGFGFGGINAHLLFEEAPAPSRGARHPRRDSDAFVSDASQKRPNPGDVGPMSAAAARGETLPRSAATTEPGRQAPGGTPAEFGAAIAVVALDAHYGPWDSLSAFRARVLGGGEPVEPTPPQHWWGVRDSAWFRDACLCDVPFAGYYLDEVSAPAGRLRIPPKELQEMLPQQLLMLAVAARALDAVPTPDGCRERTGVFVGLGLDLNTTNFHFRWSLGNEEGRAGPGLTPADREAWVRALRDAAGPPLTANRTMGALGSVVASRVAREFRLGGPSFTVSGEEGSGLRALEVAVRALQRGDVDQALVGAVDLAGDVRAVLTTHCHLPYSASGVARPFDADADGNVVGEGAAAVVLKRLDDAVRNGDRVYAVVRGLGAAGGGGTDLPVPDPAAYGAALERAYAESGIDPGTIGYLEAHAGGDPEGDAREAAALAEFFGGRPRAVPMVVGSAKADVGHAGAAGGLAGLVKACLALDQQILPPLRNLGRARAELAAADGFRLPCEPAWWLRDRADGPRRAGVCAVGVDGTCLHVVLEAWEPAASVPRDDRRSLGPDREVLFIVEGDDPRALADALARLRAFADQNTGRGLEAAANVWLTRNPPTPAAGLAVALVARDAAELGKLTDATAHSLAEDPESPLPAPGRAPAALRDRVFYTPRPLGGAGRVAFVYPGSGNDFAGMGRELALRWPEVLRRQDAENGRLRSQLVPDRFWNGDAAAASPRERIFGQVAVGCLVTDLLLGLGVRPHGALGYSLGESAALFALRAWTDRDGMLSALHASSLFGGDLTPPYDAARRAWGLRSGAAADWSAGVVDRGPDEVRTALAGPGHAYLLVINTPHECVVGGERPAVEALVRRLGARFHPLGETSSVHCPVARVVADDYRALHRLPTTPPAGVRFYSTALGRAYEPSTDSAAEAILAQSLDTVDFPTTVEAAYRHGVRVFVEVGPGASCTRLIDAILGDRPHRARSACVAGGDGVGSVLRLLAQLVAERVPVDMRAVFGAAPLPDAVRVSSTGHRVVLPVGGEPFVVPPPPGGWPRAVPVLPPAGAAVIPARASRTGAVAIAPLLQQAVAAEGARADAHAAYLRFAQTAQRGVTETVAFQTTLLEALVRSGGRPVQPAPPVKVPAPRAPGEDAAVPFMDRAACLEFAVGSVARVLGPSFAPVDAHPTRVRLPDEPLMLVDRVLTVEGEPRSLTSGRVVTEHDVRPGSWYLDGGRVPTCVAVEAGQADLFLSAYLGIDFHTRGLAVYRLLDAAVTFHRGLPGPGEVIRYDIRIDRFFRQGDTHLFRFRFEGTVGGEPLLTMTDGCAGFFTAEALAAGKGVVQTALDRRPRQGVVSREGDAFVPLASAESYDAGRVEALRRGDLAGCFGASFAGVPLPESLRLPGGRMRLVDRVTHLDPSGGRFGIGLVCAEADVDPRAWFLTCHFADDRVMPGTLMYECCLHTLRVFLLRLGWVGEGVAEPVPGVASRLKCRGQVTEATRIVTYEVTLKERGFRPEPYAVADALMYADGKPVVEITDMTLRLTGLDRHAIEAACGAANGRRRPVGRDPYQPTDAGRSPALFGPERILAFAVGKPSEAFGEPYRVFDEERVIARLPGPPYLFLDRVTRIEGAEAWKMVPGGAVEAEYDVPPDAWYFTADRQPAMPFAVLLEVALQPCGWLAAYLGSALTRPVDLCFRNLGGGAELLRPVGPGAGTLTTRIRITRVSNSGGMILQNFDFEVRDGSGPVYRGDTSFGFFSRAALAQQVGLRDVKVYEPPAAELAPAENFAFPGIPPFPGDRLRMVDRVGVYLTDGGPHGLGYVQGSKRVDPAAWFFRAHFYQDPVCPGSLGLESLLQLLRAAAAHRWGAGPGARFEANVGGTHRWLYRGQVVPDSREVTVTAVVTGRDDGARRLTADGFLAVDGRVIYQMSDFCLRLTGAD